MVIPIRARQLVGLVLRQIGIPVALIGHIVKLDPELFALGVDQGIGVAGIAVHLAPGFRNAAVAHQIGHLMRAFGGQCPEIPLHVVIAHVVVGAAFLAANEMLELQRVADEKDGRVVAHHVEIARVGVHLDREATRVAPCVGAAAFAGHGGKAHDHVTACTFLEDTGHGVFGHILRRLEGAKSARPLGVWLTLGDALAVKVGHLLKQVVVVQNNRAIGANGQRMFVALHANACVCCGVGGVFGICHGHFSDVWVRHKETDGTR